MGKYSNLKSLKLPKFALDTTFQSKVDESKLSYQSLSTAEMARAFGMFRKEKQQYEDGIKKLNVTLEALSQLLVEQMEADTVQKIQLDTGETCYIQSDPYSNIENRDELIAWLKKHKLASMLTVQWQTMNAVNKERLVNGEAPLPGTKVFLKTAARLRGGNQKEESDE